MPTLPEIQDKIEEFIKKRDRVVHKGSSTRTYQAIHLKSDRGNHPLCHVRPRFSEIVEDIEQADCRFCLAIYQEYNG